MKKQRIPFLRLPSLRIRQGECRFIYTFAVDGKRLQEFTAIARLGRDASAGDICGYQRPEVLSHIAQIRDYLESDAPMLPNSIVVAFDGRVRFEASKNGSDVPYCTPGTLVIPLTQVDEAKVGWIVDGQQRAAAIRDAEIDSFPMSVVSFIASDESEQREQFILVNSTKPLPKGLLYELLPTTTARLPDLLERRRFPSLLLDRLNRDDDSPLRGLINTPTNPSGIIKDNSILRMIENSLSDGALYRFRVSNANGGDVDAMLTMLKYFWIAVKNAFPTAWALPPKRSRLTHGAGIVSLGFLMDAIADRHRRKRIPTIRVFEADLLPLVDECRWTDGFWDFGPGLQLKWNELQNTTRHIQVLSNYLLTKYKSLVWVA